MADGIRVEHDWPLLTQRGWSRSTDLKEILYYGAIYRNNRGMLVLCDCAVEEDGREWLHVSFSYANKLPSYQDMVEVKRLFIGKGRTAYQILPKEEKHINLHPYTLHLWALRDGSSVTPDFIRSSGVV